MVVRRPLLESKLLRRVMWRRPSRNRQAVCGATVRRFLPALNGVGIRAGGLDESNDSNNPFDSSTLFNKLGIDIIDFDKLEKEVLISKHATRRF